MHLVLILLVNILILTNTTLAEDFVRLRDGRVVSGAVIRQDTLAVYLTEWEQRHLRQPEVQVFAREEVESIWLGDAPNLAATRVYKLHSGLLELGGGFGFQTWASNEYKRRFLAQLSLQGGYAITKNLGTEVVADFTAPFGKNVDPHYDSLKFGYQVALHIVGSLDLDQPWIPFAYFGGGASLEVPRAGLVETTTDDVRSLIDVGVGIKFGVNGIGLRTEIHHAFYTWTPDVEVATEVRSSGRNADATSLRVSLFTFF